MSCYFRHLKPILDEAGVSITAENKKQADRLIHEIAGVPYKDCPATWKTLKQQILADDEKRKKLVDRLREALV